MDCAPIIPFNATSVNVSGVDIPIAKAAGVDIKVGSVQLDQQTLRSASDLLESLDQAQFLFCRILPFASQSDITKIWLDANTQQTALSTLLRNLNSAQTPGEAKAAITTAANLAATATTPPVVASSAPAAPAGAAVPAAPAGAAAPAAPAGAAAPAAPAGASTAATLASDASKAAAVLQAVANAAKKP
jgi:hypothetical protein